MKYPTGCPDALPAGPRSHGARVRHMVPPKLMSAPVRPVPVLPDCVCSGIGDRPRPRGWRGTFVLSTDRQFEQRRVDKIMSFPEMSSSSRTA